MRVYDPEYNKSYYDKHKEIISDKAKIRYTKNPKMGKYKPHFNEAGEREPCKNSVGYQNLKRILYGIKGKMTACKDNPKALELLCEIKKYYIKARDNRDFKKFENKTTINWKQFDRVLGIKRQRHKPDKPTEEKIKNHNNYEKELQKIHLLSDVIFSKEFKENKIKEIKGKYGVA